MAKQSDPSPFDGEGEDIADCYEYIERGIRKDEDYDQSGLEQGNLPGADDPLGW